METLEDLFSIEVSFMTTSDKHKQQPRNPDYIDYKRVEDHRAAMEAGVDTLEAVLDGESLAAA